jgi:peptidoglycan/LPS O-acetylase OafA/YrhL
MPLRASLRSFYASLPAPLDAPRITDRADGIDFMRALLALWVLFSHLLPWAALTTGKSNLDLPIKINNLLFQSNGETHPAVLGFIVLSGYCIHRNGFRHGDDGLRTFVIRRIFRIVPVYLLATLAGLIFYTISTTLNLELGRQLTGTDAISSTCLLIKLSGAAVFLPSLHQCSFQGNAPLTTVIVEIWLYALYAFCTLFVLRRTNAVWFWRGL